jgi:alpha-L-rhamnosidase
MKMKMKKYTLCSLLSILMLASCTGETNTVSVVGLTCEYLDTPLGIDILRPRLGWKIVQTADAANGQLQTACQIIVSSTPEKLAANDGDLWNSGKMKSGQSIQVPYAGKPLQSMQSCYWKVRIWNNRREVTGWSKPSMWSMGILQPGDWKAQWIGDRPDTAQSAYLEYAKHHYDGKKGHQPPQVPSPLLRKSFGIDGEVRKAYLYVSALGYYEMYINGNRVGDRQLAPEWTDYYRRIQYQTFDLTNEVKKGDNILAAVLADGWYLGHLGPVRWIENFPRRGFYGNDRRLIAQLVVELADGSQQMIATDGSWKINPDSHILAADNFVGQIIDARKQIHGWELAGFDDAEWANVYVDSSVDKNLEAQKNEPIRIYREFKPVEITAWKDRFIVNFGQNIAGWCAMKIKGKAGTAITLRHAEWLKENGEVYTEALGKAKQTDVFILSGGDDYFEPRFTYHGFQYVEISGLDTAPDMNSIVARAVSSDPEVTGSFECSNPKLNQLFRNILQTQRNNMHSIPTDCPQRDERCGWLGDAQVFCQNSMFNMNMAGFYTKFVKDMRDATNDRGRFCSIVPSVKNEFFGKEWHGVPAWSDAGVIIPWRMYENYADVRLLEEHYAAMKKHVDEVRAVSPDLLWKEWTWNDWLNANTFSDPPENYDNTRGSIPQEEFATAFFAHTTRLLSKIAAVLDLKDDAKTYGNLADSIAAAFVGAFVGEGVKIDGHTQAAYALALHFDLLPDTMRRQAFDHLMECIEEYDCRISTGFFTTLMMMKELVRYGQTETAFKLLESERFPSWIYSINQGATTVWERWDAYVAGRGIHPSGMNSFDHYAIGSVGEWMYRHILGISPDIDRPGYEHFTIHPRPGGTLTRAKGSYHSIRGEIASSWKLEKGTFTLTVTIPPNSTATIVLPANDEKNVSVNGGKLKYTVSGDEISTTAGSGTYEFTVRME